MEALTAAIDELESAFERKDVESVDPSRLRSLLKAVGGLKLTEDGATALKRLGLRVWNACVRLTQAHAPCTLANVKLRHVACDIIAMAQTFLTSDSEEDLLLLCRFFGKTDIHNYDLATTCFNTAMEYFERIQRECNGPTEADMGKRNAVIFSIYSMRAEMAMELQETEVTYNLVTRAKELLLYLPEEVFYLAMKCYNLAILYYNNKNIPEAIRWLEESYEIYSKDPSKDPRKQSRTLRLLASAYMMVENFERASVCTSLATEEFEHPAATYLQLKLNLATGRHEPTADLVMRLICQKECTFDIALAACQLAIENRAVETAAKGLAEIAKRWHTDPREHGKAVSLHISLLVSPDVADLNAAALLADSLNANSLAVDSARAIHACLWRAASNFYENKDFPVSLQWFQRALRFIGSDDSTSRAKCHRIISRCHLELHQQNEALEYALQGARGCQDISQAQFLLFKVYLELNNAKAASECMQKLTTCTDFSVAFLEVCAYEAYSTHRDVAATALQLLLKQREGDFSRMGVILRTLIRLCTKPTVSNDDATPQVQPNLHRLCESLHIGAEKLRQIGPDVMFGSHRADELSWLAGVAWNHGLETAKSNQNELAHQLFREAADFASYQGDTGINTQALGLILSTACLMQTALPGDDGKPTLQLALSFIEKCRTVVKRWSDVEPDKAESGVGLLLMMEFTAKAKLKDPGLSHLIQQAATLSLPASKFEVMADICCQPEIALEALKISLRLHMQPTMKYDKCAPIFRKIITLTERREDSFVYYEEVSRILQGLDVGIWPPIELQYLFIAAWNAGVYYYRLLNHSLAEKWMSQALFLLKYYPDKTSYEASMYTGYSEVLKHVKPPQATLLAIEPKM